MNEKMPGAVPVPVHTLSVDWNNPPLGWYFKCFAPNDDQTEAISLGNVPFASAEAEWGPPCFEPPNPFKNIYRIRHLGTFRKATKEETVGMAQCIRLTPAKLQRFLLERLQAGDLRNLAEDK